MSNCSSKTTCKNGIDPVLMSKDTSIEEILSFYMGKNTPQRQEFIIENLRVEEDFLDDVS